MVRRNSEKKRSVKADHPNLLQEDFAPPIPEKVVEAEGESPILKGDKDPAGFEDITQDEPELILEKNVAPPGDQIVSNEETKEPLKPVSKDEVLPIEGNLDEKKEGGKD